MKGEAISAFLFTIVECDMAGGEERHDCVDVAEAERYADRMAREVIVADLAAGRSSLSCHIAIADERRQPVGVVELMFSIEPVRNGID